MLVILKQGGVLARVMCAAHFKKEGILARVVCAGHSETGRRFSKGSVCWSF